MTAIMATRKDVNIEIESLKELSLSVSELNKLSVETALSILKQYPDTYKSHIKTNVKCKAINELLKELKNEH